jgi:hypothetical protein
MEAVEPTPNIKILRDQTKHNTYTCPRREPRIHVTLDVDDEFIPPGRIRLIGPTTLYLVTLFFPHFFTPYILNLTSPYTLPLSPASPVPATGLLEGQLLQVFSVPSSAAEAWSVCQRLYYISSCCIRSLGLLVYHPQPLSRHNPSFGKQNKKSFAKTHQLHLHKYWPK